MMFRMDMCLRLLWSGVSTHTIRVPWSQSLLFRLPSCLADFLRPLNFILLQLQYRLPTTNSRTMDYSTQ